MPCGGPKEIPFVFSIRGEQRVGMLHLPQGGGPYPLLICLHSLCGSKLFYTDLARRLSFFNIAVYRFDFRGQGDSQGSLLELSLQSEVEDCKQALLSLNAFKELSFDKVALLGHSLGGAAASLVAGDAQQPIKALALWAPVLNSGEWRRSNLAKDNRVAEGKRLHPSGAILSEQLFETATEWTPDQAAASFKGPVFICHSSKDSRLPQEPAHALEQARRAQALPVEAYWPEKSDHFFEDRAEKDALYEKTSDFLIRSLQAQVF